MASVRQLLGNKSHGAALTKDIPEPENHAAEKLKSLALQLPKKFQWTREHGSIIATKEFLLALLSFPKEDQRRVIKQIGILAKEGRGYSSLKEKKIYGDKIKNTPTGSFAYRATDEIRFTCSKESGMIQLLFVLRRGDTGWSES